MSLRTHNANLSSNAKASGKKLSLKVTKDSDRPSWLSDVALKSSLLGTHHTIRTQWNPKDHDHDVKILRSTSHLTKKVRSLPTQGKPVRQLGTKSQVKSKKKSKIPVKNLVAKRVRPLDRKLRNIRWQPLPNAKQNLRVEEGQR